MREHDDLPGPKNRGALEGSMDFSASYTENLPAVLERLNISLAFTSYQAGRLMLVRSDGQQLDVGLFIDVMTDLGFKQGRHRTGDLTHLRQAGIPDSRIGEQM